MSKNWHLIISVIILTPIAFAYGIAPNVLNIFTFSIEATDLKNIFRATMTLYLAMIALWVIGVFNPRFWETATITNVLFMSGLCIGRILSFIIDGLPSLMYLTGTLAELLLALWGISNLKRYMSS